MLSRLYADRVFPWLHDLAAGGLAKERARLLETVEGSVIEIGVGSGLNLAHYDATRVPRVVGIDPAPGMLGRARGRAAAVPARIVRASAEDLPFPGGSFDAAVATLVFCTIPDPAKAALEIRRVLRPGGILHVFEHVRSARPAVARWQRRLAPLWRLCAAGCQLDRPTMEILAAAGFDVTGLRSERLPFGPSVLTEVIVGRAGT